MGAVTTIDHTERLAALDPREQAGPPRAGASKYVASLLHFLASLGDHEESSVADDQVGDPMRQGVSFSGSRNNEE